MSIKNKHLLLVASIACAAAVWAACKGSGAGSPSAPAGLGATCDQPLSLANTIVLPRFPEGKDFVPMSMSADEPVAEGGPGLVRQGAGHAIAIRVGDRRVLVPESAGAVRAIGMILPGTDLRLLVFARTGLSARGTFADRVVYDVDRSKWSLEIRLLDPVGKLVATKSIPRPGESVSPIDIDTSGEPHEPNTASILVQYDTRAFATGRISGDRVTSPVSMQILNLRYDNGALSVEEEDRERATEADFRWLMRDFMPAPSCPPSSCGKVLSAHGDVIDCGECDPEEGLVCVANVCRSKDEVPGGTCEARARSVLCAPGACGQRTDGCGGLVDCGECSEGLTCGANEPGLCGDPNVVQARDVRAAVGAKVCGCFLDDRSTTLSIDCDADEGCDNGLCVRK